MPLQYILDETGKTTAVVVPIRDWERMAKKYEELRESDYIQPEKKGLSAFIGRISPEEAERLQKHVEQSRNEWERDIF
ncbi:hypothetical protein BH24BAC1_BH24BAC1_01540 [soil metagenome]